MNTKIKWTKDKIFSVSLLAVSAILITVTSIMFDKRDLFQRTILTLPLYVSLVVGLLQSQANRFSYLLGGINCIIYSVAYFLLGLYATAFSTLLFYFPIQLVTFWRWSKSSYKRSTEFRSLKTIHWVLGGIVFVICFSVLHFVLKAAEGNYPFLDNLATMVSLSVLFLSLFRFREYSFLMPVTCIVNFTLFFVMVLDDPAQMPYLIYSINSLICVVMQFFSVRKLYKEQTQKSA